MALTKSASDWNRGGTTYSNFKAGTFLISRPYKNCRCDLCTLSVESLVEKSAVNPFQPLMIPTFNTGFGWWNVRLPSEKFQLLSPSNFDGVYIDEEWMAYLEGKRVINWCPSLRRFHPIKTTGDGNCLMHAVILATCGLQDCGMVLRRLVYFALVDASANTFRERWMKERERLNELIPGGVEMSSEEWDKEWNIIVSAAEDLRRTPGHSTFSTSYAFLEEMHVFVLANVLRRPIIIFAEPTVRSLRDGDSLEHNNFVGIYLPLLWNPALCDRNPIMLCFFMNHFQPLISRYHLPSEPKSRFAVPLVNAQLEPLHIHFLLPEEDGEAHVLLQKYLYTSEVVQASSDGINDDVILVANFKLFSDYIDWEFQDYYYLTYNYGSLRSDYDREVTEKPTSSAMRSILPSSGGRSEDEASETKALTYPVDDEVAKGDRCSPMGETSESFDADNPVLDRYTEDVPSPESPKSERQFQDVKRKTCVGCQTVYIPENNVLCSGCFQSLKDGTLKQENQNSNSYMDKKSSTELSSGKSDLNADTVDDLKPQQRNRYVKRNYIRKTPIYWREPSLIAMRCTASECKKFVTVKGNSFCADHSYENKSNNAIDQTYSENSSAPYAAKPILYYIQFPTSHGEKTDSVKYDNFPVKYSPDELLEISPSVSKHLKSLLASILGEIKPCNDEHVEGQRSSSSSRNIPNKVTGTSGGTCKTCKGHLPVDAPDSWTQDEDLVRDSESFEFENSLPNEDVVPRSTQTCSKSNDRRVRKLSPRRSSACAEVETLSEVKRSSTDERPPSKGMTNSENIPTNEMLEQRLEKQHGLDKIVQ